MENHFIIITFFAADLTLFFHLLQLYYLIKKIYINFIFSHKNLKVIMN